MMFFRHLLQHLGLVRAKHPVLLDNNAWWADFSQSIPLTECSFVVFDTELTGLAKRRDEIISIGAVTISGLQIQLDRTFHQYIRPTNLQHTHSTLIHGIGPEALKDAPVMAEVLPEFVSFCNHSLLVGHFVALDMGFLNRAAWRTLGGTMANPCVDTMRMARGFVEATLAHGYGHCDQSISYRLEDLSGRFDLPRFKPHDALEDALQTAYLFLYLLKKLKDGGVTTLRELYHAGRSLWLGK